MVLLGVVRGTFLCGFVSYYECFWGPVSDNFRFPFVGFTVWLGVDVGSC